MAGDWTEVPRWLKLTVAVMTFLLLAGLILLVVGIGRTTRTPVLLGELKFELPAGHEVRHIGAGDGRVYIAVAPPGGSVGLIVILDAGSGRRLGSLQPISRP